MGLCRITLGDNAFLEQLEAVRARLAERGASAQVAAYVEDVLVAQHQRYHAWMAAEADKRRTLVGLVRSLEARACSLTAFFRLTSIELSSKSTDVTTCSRQASSCIAIM